MPQYPPQLLLTRPQVIAPSEGDFLLPVCINSRQLNDVISYYMAGIFAKYESNNPELRLDGLWRILEAMAFINTPENTECYSVLPDEDNCVNYAPSVGWIEYAPNDPYQTPDFIPDNYIVPPWYNNPGVPLPGVQPGDAMVNLVSLPIFGPIYEAFNWPRAIITTQGVGEVEIELVKVPQGGYAAITVDNQTINTQFVDLNSLDLGAVQTLIDLLSLTIQAGQFNTETVELDFTDTGEHTIYIQFLPKVLDGTLVGFGGGIRRVGLCGVEEVEEDTNLPQFRVVDCDLQWRPNGEASWQTLVSLEACAPEPEGQIMGLRDNSCQLQIQVDSVWSNVPGASYMRREADCSFIGGVEIIPLADETLLDLTPVLVQTQRIMRWRSTRPGGLSAAGRLAVGTEANYTDTAGHFTENAAGGTGVVAAATGSSGQKVGVRGSASGNGNNIGLYGQAAGGSGTNYGLYMQTSTGRTQDYGMLQVGDAKNELIGNLGIGRTPAAPLDIRKSRGDGADIFDIMRLARDFTGTMLNGSGVAIDFLAKSSSVTDRRLGRIKAYWREATDATRVSRIDLAANEQTIEFTGLSVSAGNQQSHISFHNATPMPKPTISGDCLGNAVLKSLLGQLSSYGLIADTTTLGEPPDDDMETFRCRVATGAMSFLVYEMYAEALDIVLIELGGTAGAQIRARLNMLITTPTSFDQWADDVADFISANPGASDAIRTAIFDARDEIAQLYYCALEADGTLTISGRGVFVASLLGIDTFPVIAQIFADFCDQISFPSYAIVNSHGYFYLAENPCTLEDDCIPAGEWGKSFSFNTGNFTSTFDVTNGNYTGGAWVQDALTTPLLLSTSSYVTRANFGFECNIGDTQTAQIIDNATNAVLASSSHNGGGFSLSWAAASEAQYATEGVTFRYDSEDVFGSVGTNGRIKSVCMLGLGTAPTEGSDTETCE